MQKNIIRFLEENDTLRARMKGSVVEVARADAMALAFRHAYGFATSRRAAARYGITERHWMRARALLMAARIYDARYCWSTDDLDLISVSLERAAKSTSVVSLNMRMARDGR